MGCWEVLFILLRHEAAASYAVAVGSKYVKSSDGRCHYIDLAHALSIIISYECWPFPP